jgi:hypothetical protein
MEELPADSHPNAQCVKSLTKRGEYIIKRTYTISRGRAVA